MESRMQNFVLEHFFELLELLHAFFIVICRLLLTFLRILVFSSLSILVRLYSLVAMPEASG